MAGEVFLLTTGNGDDGNEWYVWSIHSSEEKARQEMEKHCVENSWCRNSFSIERWTVDE